MPHFLKISEGIDVSELARQLDENPELWDANTSRKTHAGSPHTQMSDIWVRYNDKRRLDLNNLAAFNNEHVPVWYPAWEKLTALRPILFDLMAKVQGEMIGGVLITRIPPGMGIAPHVDLGWHVDQYDKFYLSVRSAPGADFICEHDGVTERLNPKPGEIYLFDNRKCHSVENKSDQDRITAIMCIRTEKFGRRS